MQKKRGIVYAIVFAVILLVCLALLALIPLDNVKIIEPDASLRGPEGALELTGYDFSSHLVYIPTQEFEKYAGQLYTPQDFKNGEVLPQNQDEKYIATYRLRLRLPQGKLLGISGYSAEYAQKVFIDGEEVSAVGVPAKTAEEMTASVSFFTVYFIPQNEVTDIVVQSSGFGHIDGGGIFSYYIGGQQIIQARNQLSLLRIGFISGCIILTGILCFGIFSFFPERKSSIWLGLMCFGIALRILLLEEKAIMNLFPTLKWEMVLGMEYLSLVALVFCMFQYINAIFDKKCSKWAVVFTWAVCGIYTLVVIIMPSLFYTRFVHWFQYAGVLIGLYLGSFLVYKMWIKKEKRGIEYTLLLVGFVAFLAMSAKDIVQHDSGRNIQVMGLTQAGMVIFLVANIAALLLQFSRTEGELDKARENEKELEEQNRTLDKMNSLKEDFLATVSHEIKTPLAVISGYAQMEKWKIKQGNINEESLQNMETISIESVRLSKMAEEFLRESGKKQEHREKQNVDLGILVEQALRMCKPIAEVKRNTLISKIPAELPLLLANETLISQVLLNLIANSNKNTQEGEICVFALQQKNHVQISVEDTGDGIEDEIFPYIFERGTSSNDGNGIGLFLCREVIQTHGGLIWAENLEPGGCRVSFTLPVA